MEIKKYIEENEGRFLEELASLIEIPSISAKAEHKGDIAACAERWKQLLLEAGVDKAEVMPSNGNPLVEVPDIVNARSPIVSTLDGIVMLLSESKPKNALSPIVTTPGSTTTFVIPE